MKKKLIFIIAIIVLNSNAFSRSDLYSGFGFFGSYNLNQYDTWFTELPSVPNCCPLFTSGEGSGLSAGIFYEMPLFDNFSAQFRFGFYSLDGKLSEIECGSIIVNDHLVNAEIEHSLDISFSTVSLGIFGKYLILDNLSILGGLNFGFPVQKKYYQAETLIYPEDYGTFENGSRIRNVSDGEIEKTTSLLLFVDFGLSYDIALNKRKSLYISPEVFYSKSLNDVLILDTWKINSFRIGFSFRYSTSFDFATPLVPENR